MMENRKAFIKRNLETVDNIELSSGIAKHKKMATSPFVFFRGSAQLFYADLKASTLALPNALFDIPLTTIVGDCHTANFGFLTEEGSHGDTVIFSPNDFDDACIGHASWDLSRLICSIFLAVDHCQRIKSQQISSDKDHSTKPVADNHLALAACDALLSEYIHTCSLAQNDLNISTEVVTHFEPSHILIKRWQKAKSRAANGTDFSTKSALAKAITINNGRIRFVDNKAKFCRLTNTKYQEVQQVFRPYVDDNIHDIVLRLNAGTGSVNMDRYYLLVGPKDTPVKQLSLCHIVEVKQQRIAAPLYHFPDLSPVNQLNAAHLTVNCQRRMQRSPDLVLDEVQWQTKHWLVRSRHHAKVGVDPEHIALGKKAVNKNGLVEYGKVCGRALALAHCRGDRRSTLFEQSVCEILPKVRNELIEQCQQYANQVVTDCMLLATLLPPES